jgi:hypothetical protein
MALLEMDNALRPVETRIEVTAIGWRSEEERATDRTKSIKWQCRRKVS